MYRIWHMAWKDIRLLLRDKMGMFWAFGFPIMVALFFGTLFGGGGGGSGGGIKVAIIDEDGSPTSKKFVKKLMESESLTVETPTLEVAQSKVRKGDLAAYLLIPKGFGERAGFFGPNTSTIEVGKDPSRKAEEGFLQGIIMQSAVTLMQDRFTDKAAMQEQTDQLKKDLEKATDMDPKQKAALNDLFSSMNKWANEADFTRMEKDGTGANFSPVKLEIKSIVKEEAQGPRSSFDITFPQGIMWGILGTVTTFAVGMVVERSNGTLLRLRLAPISFMELLAGKALACFLTCMLIVFSILIFGGLFFGVHFDQPVMLFFAIICCGVCYTGIMMFLSTVGKTERAVAGIGWGTLMPLTMIGGGSIPLFFMPSWLQTVNVISPIKWSILSLEGAMWRGLSWGEMLFPLFIQLAIGGVFFALAIWMIRKQEI